MSAKIAKKTWLGSLFILLMTLSKVKLIFLFYQPQSTQSLSQRGHSDEITNQTKH